MVLVAGSAYAFARHEPQKFTATAAILFQQNELAAIATGVTPATAAAVTPSQQDTNVALVGSGGNTATKTAAAMGRPWTARTVAAAITVSPSSDTSIVDIVATAPRATAAQDVANTYAKTFVADQKQQAVGQLNTTIALITKQYASLTPQQQQSPQGATLQSKLQLFEVLAQLDNGGVQIVTPAHRPSAPSSPRIKRDALLGAILGLLLGLGIAFLLERLDRRIRDPNDLASIYGLPLLASVPDSRDYKILNSLAQSQAGGPSPQDEVFGLLRSYLRYFRVDRDLRTMLVGSARPGEGKTTVSYNLAKAAAAAGDRTLLIEADLRGPTAYGPLLDLPGASLADVLIGDARMEQAVREVAVGPNAVLDVIVCGRFPPPNAGELIESHAMESLLARAAAIYEFVVIDTSPMNVIADAIPLLTKVDGVIVVARMGLSSRDSAEQLRAKLSSLGAPVLGVVANGVSGAEMDTTRYGYRRGFYKRVEEPVPEPSPFEEPSATAKLERLLAESDEPRPRDRPRAG
jgi:capsular exopolysaccharide synthesis family protein